MTDYYATLGVSRDATTEDIRRAYRKKARQLHPDYAGPESEEAFKQVSMAYEVLSDPQKRERYDLGMPVNGSAGASPFGGTAFGFTDLFESVFSQMGGFGAPRTPASRGQAGRDRQVAVEVTLEEVVFGAKKSVMLDTQMACGACDGTCCAPGTSPVTCTTCGGAGVVTKLQNSLLGQLRVQVPCDACAGEGQTIPHPCPECNGEGRMRATRTVSVDIPAGVESGSRIKLSGQGEAGKRGGPAGDLYIEVRVLPDKLFSRSGYDLHTEIKIPMTTAALGVEFPLTTFDGQKNVVIPPGTQPEETITLRGLGVSRFRSTGRGDLHVHVGVEVPTKLDERSRELLVELARHRGEEEVGPPEKNTGLFGRLKDKLASP